MELQKLKSKLEEAKEEKVRVQERLKALKKQKQELEKELKELGVDGIGDLDKKTAELKNELEGLFEKLENVEAEVLAEEEKEEAQPEKEEIVADEDESEDLFDDGEKESSEIDLDAELGDLPDEDDLLKELDL